MNLRQTLAVVALVALVATPVAATDTGATGPRQLDDGNTTDDTSLLDESDNTTSGDDEESLLASAFRAVIPDWVYNPEELIVDVFLQYTSESTDIAQRFEDERIVFGVPAPGVAEDPTTWFGGELGDPDEGSGYQTGQEQEWWEKTWTTFWAFAFLALAGLLPAVMLAMGTSSRKPNRGTLTRASRGLVLILFGWILIALVLHLADALTTAIAPDSFTAVVTADAVEDSNAQLVGALLGGGKGTLLLTSLGILYVQYIMVFVCVALWPMMWMLLSYRSTMARTAGKIALTFTGALILLKVMQATIFRFLAELELTGSTTPLKAELAAIVGIGLVFILLPYTVLAKMVPRTLLLFGLHELREKGREDRQYQQRIGNIRKQFQSSARGQYRNNGPGRIQQGTQQDDRTQRARGRDRLRRGGGSNRPGTVSSDGGRPGPEGGD